jgi:hypothetical protein
MKIGPQIAKAYVAGRIEERYSWAIAPTEDPTVYDA